MQKLIFALLILLCSGLSMAADDEEGAEVVKERAPEYVSLGAPMVLNLSTTGSRLTFLQVKADILVEDEDAKEIVELHVPAIRHKLIVILSEKDAKDMKSPAKREQVRQQATTEIKDMIAELAKTEGIQEVLFSNFLVQ